MTSRDLPYLAYISDVPVEASYHGSALIYRLLQRYPPERLQVIEADIPASLPERRLPSVTYRQLHVARERLMRTRAHKWVRSYYTWMAPRRVGGLEPLLEGARVDAVLTIAHGFSWLTAARYARSKGKPLHLIIHDDWPRMAQLVGPMGRWLDDQFGSVYRHAATRLCVSPNMVETYQRLYGVGGTVLYPCRAADATQFRPGAVMASSTERPLVCGFGGTINMAGQVRLLRELATLLQRIGGRLHIYGPISQDSAERAGLNLPNVSLRGLVKAEQFVERLRAEVDVLFLPMSFDAQDRPNMRICFPSKLTEYTLAGLPILVWASPDSSAARWARENPGAVELVEADDSRVVLESLKNLRDPAYRHRIAATAVAAGEAFSHRRAEEVFFGALHGVE